MMETADMQLLHERGFTLQEVLVVAEALEVRHAKASIESLIDSMALAEEGADVLAAALKEVARHVVDSKPKPRPRDGHSGKRDSNRSRRGMADDAWRSLRQEIFERDGYACQYCGDGEDLTCDHIVPLVRGGTNNHDNLTTACRPCNSSKGDRLFMSEWNGRDTFQ